MNMPLTHITVTAPPDRKTPIGKDDGTEPGGGMLYVEHTTVCRVKYSQSIRRSIARADLVPCDMNGAPVPSVHLADAPDDLPGGKIIIDRSTAKKGSRAL
jgi:hypothetical protein